MHVRTITTNLHVERFSLQQSWSSEFTCYNCHVRSGLTAGDASHSALDPDAEAMKKRRTNDEFMAIPCEHKLLPGLHLDTLRQDWLHNAALGTMALSSGSTLEELAMVSGVFGSYPRQTRWKDKMNKQLLRALRSQTYVQLIG